jgi:predicted membrane protein
MNSATHSAINDTDNYLHTTAIFGGINRTIISKEFKGGTVINLFGGTKLDFTYADLTGPAVLDISQAFGETQITVPNDWRVETHVTHFCSVTEDNRQYSTLTNSNDKVLIIKGISIFALVDVLTR